MNDQRLVLTAPPSAAPHPLRQGVAGCGWVGRRVWRSAAICLESFTQSTLHHHTRSCCQLVNTTELPPHQTQRTHLLTHSLHGKRKMETKIIFSFINCNTDDVLWGWGYCYWCPTRPNWFPYEWRKIYIFFGEGNIFIIYCSPTLMLRSNKSQVLFPVASGPSAGNGSKLEGSIFAAILSRFPHIEHWSYWLLVAVIIMVGKLSSAEQVRIIV